MTPKKQQPHPVENQHINNDVVSDIYIQEEENKTEVNTMMVSNISFTGELHELDAMIKTMMLVGQNRTPDGKTTVTVCQLCGKEGYKTQIRDHIEANHVDGLVIPCDHCEKTFRSRNALRVHKIRRHNK